MNEFMKFLQKFRKQNPGMAVPEAAKAAGALYRKGRDASNIVSEVVVEKTKLGKKKKQTRRKRRGSRRGSRKR